MSAPLVSVVIPTYNRLAFLPIAIESVLAQTFTDFEVLVSDNGPSSQVRDLVGSYGDERLHYRHNNGNIGSTGNALASLGAARGSFLAMLHDDDSWEPDCLERLVPALLSDATLSVAFCDYSIVDQNGNVDQDATVRAARATCRDRLRTGVYRSFGQIALVDKSVFITGAAVLRRIAINLDDWPKIVDPIYDLWLAYLAAKSGGGAYYCSERLFRYRTHGGSTSVQFGYEAQQIACYDLFARDDSLVDIRPALRRMAGVYHVRYGLSLLAAGQSGQARHELAAGLRSWPQVRAVLGMLVGGLPGSSRLGRLAAKTSRTGPPVAIRVAVAREIGTRVRLRRTGAPLTDAR
jgi:glycosyltransferase involved in cell wall biosynthesis